MSYKEITPNISEIKTGTPAIKIGDTYFVGGIGGDFIPAVQKESVTLGQVNAEGKFQPLSFSGTEASNSGNPETVDNYYSFDGVLPIPESGSSGGGATVCDLYKCTAVQGPQIISFVVVSGAGVTDCNGNYSDIGISKNGQPVYSYTSSSGKIWYIFLTHDDLGENTWVLADTLDISDIYAAYYYNFELVGSWYGGDVEYDGDKGRATVSFEYSAINSNQDKTWSGYKLTATEEGYVLSDELTTGLIYAAGASSDYVTDCIIPKVGGVYNSDCTAEICNAQFKTDDALTFTAEEAFSTVKLDGSGSKLDLSGVKYSIDGNNWISYTQGTVIKLDKAGDYVKFINDKNMLETEPDNNTSVKFTLTGKIAASGKLMSLLNYSNDFYSFSFESLFSGQSALTSIPDISCDTVGWRGLFMLFRSCPNITKARVPIKQIKSGHDGFYQMFGGCTNLSVIEVDFTSWTSDVEDSGDVFSDWVSGVANKGVFIKPAELTEEYGSNRIPEGWTVVNK